MCVFSCVSFVLFMVLVECGGFVYCIGRGGYVFIGYLRKVTSYWLLILRLIFIAFFSIFLRTIST